MFSTKQKAKLKQRLKGNLRETLLLFFVLCTLAGCSQIDVFNPVVQQDREFRTQLHQLATQQRWLEVVDLHRTYLREFPNDTGYQEGMLNAQENAVEFYGSLAERLANEGNLQAALSQVEQGLLSKPGEERLLDLQMQIVHELESDRLLEQGERSFLAGNDTHARSLVNQASYLRPDDQRADRIKRLATGINRSTTNRKSLIDLKPKSFSNVDLSFNNTPIEDVADFIAEPFGINILLEELSGKPINLFATGVSFNQAIELISHAAGGEFEVVGPYTIVLRPKGSETVQEKGDTYVRLFNLRSIPAKTMAENLSVSLGIEGVVVNERTNSIQVKGTADKLRSVEQIIEANDQEVGEVLLQVEIVEVSKSDSERLGLDIGSQVSASIPQFTVNDATGGGFLDSVIPSGIVSLPAATFRYFKQRVNAQVLANPSVRAIDDKVAKIHVGDRIPLRTSTTQDSNGQTKTNFEYRDVGISLEVTPNIRLDNSVELDVKLEISSLGQNLGTSDTPAYAIGTRNVETSMLLRNKEIAVMGGLIRDEERKTRQNLPGLGTSSSIGKLFSQKDDQNSRTDIFLTIRPVVIRPQGLANRNANMVRVSTAERSLPSLATAAKSRPTIKLGNAATNVFDVTDSNSSFSQNGGFGNSTGNQFNQGNNSNYDFTSSQPVSGKVNFDQRSYEVKRDNKLRISLLATNLQTGGREERLALRFNPSNFEVIGVQTGNAERGNIATNLRRDQVEIVLQNAVQLQVGRLLEIELIAKRRGQTALSFQSLTTSAIVGEQVDAFVR